MTIRRDYLLRIIDEFFKFLSKILKLKDAKEYQQAFLVMEETSQTLLHAGLNEFTEIQGLILPFVSGKGLTMDQIEILAELLKVKADIEMDLFNNFSALNLYEKSLELLQHIQSNSKNFSLSRIEKIDDIRDILAGLKG